MEYTEEMQKDFLERAKAFQEEFAPLYEELKQKHQCELVHGVVTVPGPGGVFGLAVNESVGDTKHKQIPSPFIEHAEGD
jgi:hypothetical protein